MAEGRSYRLEDLRRLGVALASGLGVSPARASAFLSYLLWFDAAGAHRFGVGSLPDWLDGIDSGAIDPKAEGKVRAERPSTALLDGEGGLGPLILARAAMVAGEKAREVGLGAVRVVNLARQGPIGPILADLSTGPLIGSGQGPGPSWSVAVPVRSTMPAVWDSALIPTAVDGPRASFGSVPAWSLPYAEGGGWLISAQAFEGIEPLSSFHARVESRLAASPPGPGEVRPSDWQAARDDQTERGLILGEAAVEALGAWADRLGIAWPGPNGGQG